MALDKSKHQLYQQEQTIGSRPWPHLPQQLITIIEREPRLIQNLSFSGVTKSWIATAKACDPRTGKSLLLQLLEIGHGSIPYIFDLERRGCYRPIPEWIRRSCKKPRRFFVGCSYGGVFTVLVDEPSRFELWNPLIEMGFIPIPIWDSIFPLRLATLSSPLKDCNDYSSTMMVLTGMTHPAFAFYRKSCKLGRFVWTMQDCKLVDPHASNKQLMKFIHAIGFEGKFYALSMQGTLAVLEEIDDGSHFVITRISTSRAVPFSFSRHFREYLVESGGEILLVFLISRKSSNVVDDVEVFQLDFPRLCWIKKENLGDRTLFVGQDCCMWVSATKVGCRSNCVCFTHGEVDGWWVYDMEASETSPACLLFSQR